MHVNSEISPASLLLARFQGRVQLPFGEALAVISYPIQTARNQRTLGTFPIPVVQRGRKLFINVDDLIRFIDGEKKKRRGRRTKAEMFAAGGAQ